MSWKRSKEWIDRLSSIQNVVSLLSAPVVASMITAATGYVGGIPAMWIVVGATVVFAAVAHGLFYATKYRLLTSAADKLEYMGSFCQLVCFWDENGRLTNIKTLQIGLHLCK
jgi:hypothetical protein